MIERFLRRQSVVQGVAEYHNIVVRQAEMEEAAHRAAMEPEFPAPISEWAMKFIHILHVAACLRSFGAETFSCGVW